MPNPWLLFKLGARRTGVYDLGGVSPRALLLRARHLLRQDRHIVNVWLALKELQCPGEKVLCDFTVQVRITALLIRKRIENRVTKRRYMDREPSCRPCSFSARD